jgi:hypothetical protein
MLNSKVLRWRSPSRAWNPPWTGVPSWHRLVLITLEEKELSSCGFKHGGILRIDLYLSLDPLDLHS